MQVPGQTAVLIVLIVLVAMAVVLIVPVLAVRLALGVTFAGPVRLMIPGAPTIQSGGSLTGEWPVTPSGSQSPTSPS